MGVALDPLFEAARSRGGVDCILTLVRVAPASYETLDPIAQARGAAATDKGLRDEERTELKALLRNLLRCANQQPFLAFDETEDHALASMARDRGFVAIGDALEAGGDEADRLLRDLLSSYDRERMRFVNAPRLHKLPDFAVLELIVDDESGLAGFRVHFSNGEHAEFTRTDTSTLPLNLTFDDDGSVVFFVGDVGALTTEWKVGGRALWEVGLEGRYNPPGVWRPLEYPADWSEYARRAHDASDRPDVQGALLYIFLTGHHAVEFAVKTSVQLPGDETSFGGGRLHLQRLPEPLETIYDGTAYLAAPDAAHVEDALRGIQAMMNRIAFAFDSSVVWTPKYLTENRANGRATPSDEDLHLLDHLLDALDAPGRAIVDQAIDWYNRGRSASNEFVAFLCAYIAFESTALAVWQGDLPCAVALEKPPKTEWRDETARCIEALHDLSYGDDPEAFVRQAYFDCVIPLSRRVERAARAVLGETSREIELLYEARRRVARWHA